MSVLRGALLLAALTLLAGSGVAIDPPLGPKMEFDKKEKENPAAPNPNEIRATGTFLLTEGYTFTEVRVWYRPEGTRAWKRADRDHVKVSDKVKDGRRAWEVVIKDVPAGVFVVKGELHMRYEGIESNLVQETEPTRKVTVHEKIRG